MPKKKVEIKPADAESQEAAEVLNVLFEDMEIDLDDDMEIIFEFDPDAGDDDEDDDDYEFEGDTGVSIYSIK